MLLKAMSRNESRTSYFSDLNAFAVIFTRKLKQEKKKTSQTPKYDIKLGAENSYKDSYF